MTDFVQIEWRVPSGEWRAFVDYVESEYGENSRHTARELDTAMREWLREDGDDPLAERIETLADRVGGTVDGSERTKKNSPDTASGDTEKVFVRVDPDLKARFTELADRGDHTRGECLARALRARREGGRDARLCTRLDAVLDALDAGEGIEGVDTDAGADAGPSVVEQRTRRVVDRIRERFHADPDEEIPEVGEGVIHGAIREELGDSQYKIDTYTDRVADHLGLIPHTRYSVFIDPDQLEQQALEYPDIPHPDAPAVDRKDPSDLSKEERVDAVRVAFARERFRGMGEGGGLSFGRRGMTAGDLNEAAFDGALSERIVQQAAERAGRYEGWEWRRPRAAFGAPTGKYRLSMTPPDLSGDDPAIEAITHDRWIERERATRAELASSDDAQTRAEGDPSP